MLYNCSWPVTKVQEKGNSIPSSLHYALTDSQCNKCGAQLQWKVEFNVSTHQIHLKTLQSRLSDNYRQYEGWNGDTIYGTTDEWLKTRTQTTAHRTGCTAIQLQLQRS